MQVKQDSVLYFSDCLVSTIIHMGELEPCEEPGKIDMQSRITISKPNTPITYCDCHLIKDFKKERDNWILFRGLR